MTKTARLEPVTPAGNVDVREPFVAVAESQRWTKLDFENVGNIALAKNYGNLRTYHLPRRLDV